MKNQPLKKSLVLGDTGYFFEENLQKAKKRNIEVLIAYSGALEHQLREHLNKNTKHLNSLPEMSPQYRKNSLHWGTEKKP